MPSIIIYDSDKSLLKAYTFANIKDAFHEVKIENDGYIRASFQDTNVSSLNSYLVILRNYLKQINDAVYPEDSVVNRNECILDIVNASCFYGNVPKIDSKLFCLLIGSDIHGDKVRMESIITYLNNIDCIDAGIMLGDMSGSSRLSGVDYYKDAIAKSKKDFLTVVGNHDMGNASNLPDSMCQTRQELYDYVMADTIKYAGVVVKDPSDPYACFYYKDFTSYKIRLLVLNQFDCPDTLTENRNHCFFSQAQIGFVINALDGAIANDYGVIIALHASPSKATVIDSLFSVSKEIGARATPANINIFDPASGQGILPEIVKAFKTGSNVDFSCGAGDSQITAKHKFASEGHFICYIGGHYHQCLVSNPTGYPDQLQFSANVANSFDNNGVSDMPRKERTRSEDSFFVLSVDTANKAINIVSIGAHMTSDMRDRLFIQLPY